MTFPSPRWLWVIGASLSLLVVVLVGSHYTVWKSARLHKSAERALEREQPVEAALDAAAALQIRPGDPQLTQILGNAYDATNDERLLDVLQEQIARQPDSLDSRFRLARAAMRFGRLDVSAAAIENMPAAAEETVDYHEIASALATLAKRGPELLDHARALHRLDPDNPEHILKLAGLAILAGKYVLEADEMAQLKELSQQADGGGDEIEATTLLWGLSTLSDFPDGGGSQIQSRLLSALHRESATFRQKLHALDLADALGHTETAQSILEILKASATDHGDLEEISLLLAWTSSKGDPADALAWARELELFSGSKPPASTASVLADICARTSSWKELDWLVTGTDWGNGNFVRHLYAAKCAEQLPSSTTELKRESFLRLALKDSRYNPAHIQLLWNTARKYGWRDLAQPLSWALADQTRTARERTTVLQSIASEALAAGDLDGFRRATMALMKTSPGQWELRNNDYYTRLLREGCDPDLLAEIATFQQEFPAHADVITTYALALYLSGDSAAAARSLDGLSEDQRKAPAVAPFCALIFAAAGDPQRAQLYRDIPHQLFFAEERALLAKSR